MDAALRRERLTLTGLLKRAGRAAMDDGLIPSVHTDKCRLTDLKVEQRKRRRELVEARRGSSVSVETVKEPVIDWVDPVLKHVVAKKDTWRNAISEHVTLLSSTVGTNRKSGGEGKTLVKWMTEQAYVLSDLLDNGVLPDGSGGGVAVMPGTSGVLRGPVVGEVDSVAVVVHRDPPTKVVEKPTVLPDL